MNIQIIKRSIISLYRLVMLSFIFIVVFQVTTAVARYKSDQISQHSSDSLGDHLYKQPDMDYEIIPLPVLIEQSELIISGKVKEVKDSTFIFAINDTIKGTPDNSEIEVIKFIPRRFDGPREVPYKKGQSFMLFVSKEEDDSNKFWRIRGIAGEGEVPVENGYVYFKAWNIKESAYNHYKVHGKERWIQRYPETVFKNAVGTYLDCFTWKLVEGEWIPEQTCTESAVNEYRSESIIHSYLVLETLKRIPDSGDR